MGLRFRYIIVDEFQDTDPLQFDIFRRIYAGGDSHVFVVGDPKQAIYSFRNADLHTYLRAAGWATNRWSLAANQRSSKPLLTAINGLFEVGTIDREFQIAKAQTKQLIVGQRFPRVLRVP